MIPYFEDFFSEKEADAEFERLRELPFVRTRNPFNSKSRVRHLTHAHYSIVKSSYGGTPTTPFSETPDNIKKICLKLAAFSAEHKTTGLIAPGSPVNYASVLAYLSDDFMIFHQHKEDTVPVLLESTVYVASFGAMHPVAIREEGCKDKSKYEIIYPKHGSVYVLPHGYNVTHEHAVLESDDVSYDGLRIAINFKHRTEPVISGPPGGGLRPKSREKTGASSPSSPRVCWGSRADFPDAVYTGRRNWRGKFHYEESPFANNSDDGHGNHRTGEAFREYALEQVYGGATMLMHLKEARGKDLLCPWCKPGEPNCHARVWLELANLPDAEFDKLCAEATENFTALQEKRHAEMAKWNPLWARKSEAEAKLPEAEA